MSRRISLPAAGFAIIPTVDNVSPYKQIFQIITITINKIMGFVPNEISFGLYREFFNATE